MTFPKLPDSIKSVMESLKFDSIRPDQWFILACIAGAGLLIYCIFLGATKRIVFYRNKTDMFLSFIAWVLVFIFAWIAMSPENKELFQRMCIIVAGATLLLNIFTAWSFNPGYYRLLAIPIGVSKAVLSLLFVVIWIELLFGSTKRRRNQTFQLSAIAGLLGVLIYSLINGDKVKALR